MVFTESFDYQFFIDIIEINFSLAITGLGLRIAGALRWGHDIFKKRKNDGSGEEK